MKAKEELEEAIKDTITGYKETIFGSDTPSVWRVWMNFESNKSLIKKYMIKSWWMRKEGDPEELQKNIVIDGDTMIDGTTSVVLDSEVDSTYWEDKF